MKTRSFLLIVLSGILWGTSGVFFNLMTPKGFAPLQMTFIRASVSALMLSLGLFIFNKKTFKIPLKQIPVYMLSGAFMFLAAACYYSAIDASSVSTAVILMYTAPIFVMTYSVLFLGERLTGLKLLSVAMMLAGCALVSGIIGGMKFSFWGVFLGIMAGVCYAGYNVVAKISTMKGISPVSTSLYSFIFMAVTSFFFGDPAGIVSLASADPLSNIPLMLGLGLFTCVIPYSIYTVSLKDIPVGTASSLGMIEPLSATVYSVVFFSEKLSVPLVIGMVLIISAVFILNKNID